MFNVKKVIIMALATNLSIVGIVNADFSGRWCWDKDSNVSAFSVVIKKAANVYTGGYYSVALSGNKIDDNEFAFRFQKTKENIVKTKLKAGITGNTGLIELKLIRNSKIEWSVLKYPEGDIFVPQKASLHRC